jgi:predicted  nucleic acid-binding Zn-ribbon protein
VAAVENGVCQVCHMIIPPQKFIELQRDQDIMQCPHCHRFIYWPGHEGYCLPEGEADDI